VRFQISAEIQVAAHKICTHAHINAARAQGICLAPAMCACSLVQPRLAKPAAPGPPPGGEQACLLIRYWLVLYATVLFFSAFVDLAREACTRCALQPTRVFVFQRPDCRRNSHPECCLRLSHRASSLPRHRSAASLPSNSLPLQQLLHLHPRPAGPKLSHVLQVRPVLACGPPAAPCALRMRPVLANTAA
jgi:hypothetical protein